MPPGYSAATAASKAQPTADHVRTRKGKYDRALLMSFQTSAGLKSDGLYGPQVAAALRFFKAKNVPAPLFRGSNATYAPPAGG
jgi:murein L,D-transpeptidase YcbB/YkuD